VQGGVESTRGPTDEGADHVIVLIAVAVIAHGRLVQRLLDVSTVTRSVASAATSSAVSARRASPPPSNDQVDGLGSTTVLPPSRGLGDARSTTAWIASGSGAAVAGSATRQQRRYDENDGFSVVAATSSTTRFSTAQQRVLLGLGESVHLVDEQHGLLAVRGRRRATSMTARTSLTPPTAPKAPRIAGRWPARSAMRASSCRCRAGRRG